MDKKLRNTLIAIVIFVGISISIYLLHFLPRQSDLTNLIKCNEIGMKMYEKEKMDHPAYIYYEPKFVFRNNTCISKGGWSYRTGSGLNNDSQSNFIRDVYSNIYLAEFGFLDGYKNPFGDREKYDELNNKFFPK